MIHTKSRRTNAKKYVVCVLAVCAALWTGQTVMAQETAAPDPAKPKAQLQFQPYLELWYLPAAGDSFAGETNINYRAFNVYQAGLKVTGTYDKAQVYVESRGVPSGGAFNQDDVNQGAAGSWANNALYYAWGKYQFTSSGNLWAGKFKPLFGPNLIDESVFGAGWQQKAGENVSLGVFLVQPKIIVGKGATNSTALTKAKDGKGFGALLTADVTGKTGLFNAGLYYALLGDNDQHQLVFDSLGSWRGVKNLTLSGEFIFSLTAADETAVGLGLYLAAEYQILNPFSAGLALQWTSPSLGAEKIAAYDTVSAKAGDVVEGFVSSANVELYGKFKPANSFYIQAGVTVKAANAFNETAGKDKTPVDVKILFRWEPRFTVAL